MVYTKEFNLPTYEEITVPELNLGTAALIAGSVYYGQECLTQNDEFMLCRFEEKDPRKCLNEGKAVTACAVNFFRKMRKNCLEEFEQYSHCIDKSSRELSLYRCRNTQAVLDKCVLEKMNIERPEYGFYCKPRVHETSRPKPPGYQHLEFPDKAVPPNIDERTEARYGSRKHYTW
ncbi:NADH dehydrogenase [ubiquinone] 1 alpha subcomplex subunit 8 [Armadillidium nasatum]|uniref:NADH dehydrogenase [ubiquinone] 1 alpha subcomplex subunit 8 n=1 Tax=Armadillidium nasatum TaxID=96803 RepID=A0A5N5TA04_9CRUS|nr:NADH dehydrogenase [ubiquinone] 1 alpha subcomplex subunit 8 [Armadillidium nasatum]